MNTSNLSRRAKNFASCVSTSLPPLSEEAKELMGLSDSERADPKLLALIALKDPIYSGRLIAAANNAALAHLGAVLTTAAAAKRLGAVRTYDVLLAVAVLDSLQGVKISTQAREILTVSTLALVVTARRFGAWARLGAAQCDVFSLAATLYCTGLFAILNHPSDLEQHYSKALKENSRGTPRCLVVGADLYGAVYFSAEVAKAWGMRQDVVDALTLAADVRSTEKIALLVNAPGLLIRAKLLNQSQKAVLESLTEQGALAPGLLTSDELDLVAVT